MPISPLVKPIDVAPAIEEHEEEEEHSHLPARMRTPPPGEETPRVGRSPSPPPRAVFDDEDEEAEDESSEDGEQREMDEGHGLDDAAYVHRMRHSNSVAALGFEIDDYKRKGAFTSRGSRQSLRSMLEEEDEAAQAPHPSQQPSSQQPAQAPPTFQQPVQAPPSFQQPAQAPITRAPMRSSSMPVQQNVMPVQPNYAQPPPQAVAQSQPQPTNGQPNAPHAY